VSTNLVFQPIVTKKIYEEIVDQLRDLIARGELKPGQKLPSEREMSESMGVSRASVREALTAMEAIGILDIRPGEGTFVKETSSLETFKPLAFVLAVKYFQVWHGLEPSGIVDEATYRALGLIE
jgi:GntR family transcriptional repressor for pyruvate dehydrogenase complex